MELVNMEFRVGSNLGFANLNSLDRIVKRKLVQHFEVSAVIKRHSVRELIVSYVMSFNAKGMASDGIQN